MAGLYQDVWTGDTIKAFRLAQERIAWLNKIKSYDGAVASNNTINFTELGGDPAVLVNNSSYPLQIQTLSDQNKVVTLHKYQTKPTRVTDDVAMGIGYEVKASVIERHRDAILDEQVMRAMHSLAPAGDTSNTPVVVSGTTGKIKASDIIGLKAKFDAMKMPLQGRILVLAPEHAADLLTEDTSFAQRYNANTNTGAIANLYGFEVYECNSPVFYTVSTQEKVAYGTAPTSSTDEVASVAFSLDRVMKASGITKAYIDEPTTVNQEWLYNVRTYNIVAALKNEGIGALVRKK